MSKTVEVSITKEDELGNRTTIRVRGEEAEKWAKTLDGWTTFMFVHGQNFPELKWETLP